MSLLDHDHAVDAEQVGAARAGGLAADKAGQLALGAAGELCAGDLALALEVTEDQVSYALKMLRLARLVSFRKDGRMVFYRLSDGFPDQLLEHCLPQLLSVPCRSQAGDDGA
jgi:DNA-binding transcriptional ArsR family regulator